MKPASLTALMEQSLRLRQARRNLRLASAAFYASASNVGFNAG